MLKGDNSIKYRLIYEMATREDAALSVKELCELAGVSRSCYYYWLKHGERRLEREREDREAFKQIMEAYNYRGYTKGARSIYMRLIHKEPPVIINIKKIRRLMKKYKLFCPIRKRSPYRKRMKEGIENATVPNILMREFRQHGIRKVLLTDITYISCRNKFYYLATIMDAYTKQILAYTLSETMEEDFVLETVKKMMEGHGIEMSSSTMIHSDQGAHYRSCRFRELIENVNLRRSMSRKGNCWDNAPQESFFGHMKDEVDLVLCESFDEVKEAIDDWMDYYNNERYQWELEKLSPNEYYEYRKTGEYPLNLPTK